MNKKQIFISCVLFSALLISCKSNDVKEDNGGDNEPPIVDKLNLGTFLKKIQDGEDYKVTVTGNQITYYEKTMPINKEIVFKDNLYYVNEDLGTTNFSGGYLNIDGGVGIYNLNYDLLDETDLRTDVVDYHSIVYSLADLDISNYLNNDANTDTLEITTNILGEVLVTTDYLNILVISNALKLGTYVQIINEMDLSFNDETNMLTIDIVGEVPIQVTTDLMSTISIDLEAQVSLIDENYLENISSQVVNATFSKKEVSAATKELYDKIDSGYKINDLQMGSSLGGTITGDVFSTKDYIVYDYSDNYAEYIQGYAIKNGTIYKVTPTSNGTNTYEYLTKGDIKDLNEEMGTNYSATQIAKILFQSDFGLYLPDSTLISNNLSLLNYDMRTSYFLISDPLNLYGIGSEVDNDFSVSSIQGGLAGGYLLYYEDIFKNTINFGYFIYQNNDGTTSMAKNEKLVQISDFGSTNPSMEIIVNRL